MSLLSFLLIVPCGIETLICFSVFLLAHRLLIVPCGIETYPLGAACICIQLLIVPCGIETSKW